MQEQDAGLVSLYTLHFFVVCAQHIKLHTVSILYTLVHMCSRVWVLACLQSRMVP